jgi:hypothetical protein
LIPPVVLAVLYVSYLPVLLFVSSSLPYTFYRTLHASWWSVLDAKCETASPSVAFFVPLLRTTLPALALAPLELLRPPRADQSRPGSI